MTTKTICDWCGKDKKSVCKLTHQDFDGELDFCKHCTDFIEKIIIKNIKIWKKEEDKEGKENSEGKRE